MTEIKSKDKIIQTQQSVIYDLEKQIKQLKEENLELKNELEFEKNKPNEGYKKAQDLLLMAEEKRIEYQQLIDDFKEERELYRKNYEKKIQEIGDIKEKYRKKLQDVVKTTKKEIRWSRKMKSKDVVEETTKEIKE